MDGLLKRSLAQRIFERTDAAGAGNIRCRWTSGRPAPRQRRRGHRHRHSQRAERHPPTSNPFHAKSHVELLGLARHGNGRRRQLHCSRRWHHSDAIPTLAGFSTRKLQHVRSRWRNLSPQSFGNDSLVCRYESASVHHHQRIPKLWDHPRRQRRQRRPDRHTGRPLE